MQMVNETDLFWDNLCLKSECWDVLGMSLMLRLLEMPTKSQQMVPTYCNAKACLQKEVMLVSFFLSYCLLNFLKEQ